MLFRMTITLTSYKPKEFVILASSSETKDPVTAPPTIPHSPYLKPQYKRTIDSESHSFLVVQNDDYFIKL
ncbi:hypothetical protein THZB04_40284 [Vibrio owensii]|nr:hypothetical protein THZB04_40284 [Vibrio owensii]